MLSSRKEKSRGARRHPQGSLSPYLNDCFGSHYRQRVGMSSGRSGIQRSVNARHRCSRAGKTIADGESNALSSSNQPKRKRGLGFDAVAAKSSIKQLYDIIANFSTTKRDLVEETGFKGILQFPPLRQINRRFAVWLMSKVDAR